MQNALADSYAPLPSARPMDSRNALARLMFNEPQAMPVGGDLPARPARDVVTNRTQQYGTTMRDARDYALDPRSVGNQIVVNMATSAAPVDVRGGARAVQGIRAYHGSPHRFDRFDMSRIGTGEGAQAYGHGLYFADSEDVARTYRTTLSGDPTIDGRALNWTNPAEHAAAMVYSEGGRDGAIRALTKEVEYLRGTRGFSEANNDAARALRFLQEGGAPPAVSTPGSMYEVNLRVSPDRLLDWDAPLSQQPRAVREALGRFGLEHRLPGNVRPVDGGFVVDYAGADGARRTSRVFSSEDQARRAMDATAQMRGLDPTGGQIYESPRIVGGDFRAPPLASETLRDAGVEGIRYLDGGSRAAGEGSRNYVIFNDELIDILRRYGLLGMVGGGAAATAGGEGG